MNKKRSTAILLFKLLPLSLPSRIAGYLTRIPLPPFLMDRLVRWYCTKFSVKDEYLVPEGGFRTFNDFFTRKLQVGSRTIATGKQAIVSPVDARIDQFGAITDTTLIQAKGLGYSLEDLIPSETYKEFRNGHFVTLYLSPADYHRIHAPVSGDITGYFTIPGSLYTVQEYMVRGLKNLFPRNERVITYIDTGSCLVGVCKVGATNVGRISLSYCDEITNRWIRRRKEVFYENKNRLPISTGDELGIFHLGSTIILLFQEGVVRLQGLTIGGKVLMGQQIGTLRK